jgi:hypothetical protein
LARNPPTIWKIFSGDSAGIMPMIGVPIRTFFPANCAKKCLGHDASCPYVPPLFDGQIYGVGHDCCQQELPDEEVFFWQLSNQLAMMRYVGAEFSAVCTLQTQRTTTWMLNVDHMARILNLNGVAGAM